MFHNGRRPKVFRLSTLLVVNVIIQNNTLKGIRNKSNGVKARRSAFSSI